MPAQPKPYSRDDDYWTALFQEETKIDVSSPYDGKVDWSPLGDSSDNGRFNPADEDKEDPWQMAQTLFEADEVLELNVTGYNKGGLLIRWQGLQGFVPASQLIDFAQYRVGMDRDEALQAWVDKSLKLKIVEIEPVKFH